MVYGIGCGLLARKKKARKVKYSWTGAAIVVLIFVLAVVSLLAYNADTRSKELERKLDLATAQIASMEKHIQNLSASVENASNVIEEQKTYISSLEYNNSKLEKSLEKANSELENKDKELKEKGQQLSALKTDINSTLDELKAYETRLNDRMNWFRENSNIDHFSDYKHFQDSLKSRCVKLEHGDCNINLACLSFVNSYKEGLEYKTDNETSGTSDALQNLESIISNKGGDCEDFSILFMAELNYLTGFCTEKNTNASFTGFVQGGSIFYVENSRTYYLKNTEKKQLPKEYENYYMACGNFPEAPNVETSSDVVGHCVVAFSPRPIASSKDVYSSLKDAILVEPQTGELVYDLRNDTEMLVPSNSTYGRYFLYLVVTDKDSYDFDGNSGEWKGFEDFLSFVKDRERELNPNAFIP
ncbi:MAG: hypothetical protein J7L23_04245 [Candidatus Diapherotrites archaeon]|nr:hypothetical protein [Candidatus Diapherotrites archaeon]